MPIYEANLCEAAPPDPNEQFMLEWESSLDGSNYWNFVHLLLLLLQVDNIGSFTRVLQHLREPLNDGTEPFNPQTNESGEESASDESTEITPVPEPEPEGIEDEHLIEETQTIPPKTAVEPNEDTGEE
jgi:hypothetical protein